MKKKSIIVGVITIAVIVIGIYLLVRPKVLGNMNGSYSEQITTTSEISFSGEAGERIKFLFRSNIVSGDLDMVLYNSLGNEVYTLDKAKVSETIFTLNSTDTYILAAECNNFIGKYKISIYKEN